jgi:hypothetical protein
LSFEYFLTIERKKRKVTLSFQNVGGHNINPVDTPTYQKATQTASVGVGGEEDKEKLTTSRKVKETGVDAPKPKEKEETKTEVKPKEEPKETELTPEDKEQIMQTAEFTDFVSKTSKLMERALYVSSKVDVVVDYTQTDDEDKTK